MLGPESHGSTRMEKVPHDRGGGPKDLWPGNGEKVKRKEVSALRCLIVTDILWAGQYGYELWVNSFLYLASLFSCKTPYKIVRSYRGSPCAKRKHRDMTKSRKALFIQAVYCRKNRRRSRKRKGARWRRPKPRQKSGDGGRSREQSVPPPHPAKILPAASPSFVIVQAEATNDVTISSNILFWGFGVRL